MHDTSFHISPPCTDICETTFDPKNVESVTKDWLNGVSDADFIAEYRRTLLMLNIKVQSDYSEVKSKYQSQARRLDALEGLVPTIHMQNQQVQIVTREIRALKRIVTDLQCTSEKQQQPFIKRLLAHFSMS